MCRVYVWVCKMYMCDVCGFVRCMCVRCVGVCKVYVCEVGVGV